MVRKRLDVLMVILMMIVMSYQAVGESGRVCRKCCSYGIFCHGQWGPDSKGEKNKKIKSEKILYLS